MHHKRFMNVVNVVEGQRGESHPEKVTENKLDCSDETKHQETMDKCNKKLLTCLFVQGENEKSCKKCVNEMNDVCWSGSD